MASFKYEKIVVFHLHHHLLSIMCVLSESIYVLSILKHVEHGRNVYNVIGYLN